MYCQEPLLRAASRCHMLDILVHSTDFSNLALNDEDIIDAFKRLMNFVGRKEILIRHTKLWQKVICWVEPHLQHEDYESLLRYLESNVQSYSTQVMKYQVANLIGFLSVLWSDAKAKTQKPQSEAKAPRPRPRPKRKPKPKHKRGKKLKPVSSQTKSDFGRLAMHI